MPLPIDHVTAASVSIPSASYPATTKQAAGHIDGILTDVTSTIFSDKILVTITQGGRLAQWIHVPLEGSNATATDQYLPSATAEDNLLPMAHLTPKTLLGASNSERETIGQLYAAQIASFIANKNPDEKRTVLIGLGLNKAEASREDFYNVVDLVRKCL
ncbi:MAG: hypothetical protein LQ352_007740 [Teloschistes flavicans]|nr:MAG: hypothetical protein LQ352_007740 [Teloschistes flavicans]